MGCTERNIYFLVINFTQILLITTEFSSKLQNFDGISKSTWMTDVYDKIKDRRLGDIIIPGTYASASFHVGSNIEYPVEDHQVLKLSHFLNAQKKVTWIFFEINLYNFINLVLRNNTLFTNFFTCSVFMICLIILHLISLAFPYFHNPCMWIANVFSHVCLSVWNPFTWKLHLWYVGTSLPYLGQVWVSRSFGSRSRSYEKNDNFTYFNMLILCMWLHAINKVKAIHQGEYYIMVKVKISNSLPVLCYLFCPCIYLKGLNRTNGRKVTWRSRWNEVGN